MNIQEQVARRRAELEQQERQVALHQKAADAERKAEEQVQRTAAVEQLTADLAADGVPVRSDGEELAIAQEPRTIVDVEELRRSKVRQLIRREARRLWTPGDNWLVISLIVSGVTLIHLAGFGLILLGLGFWRRAVLNRRYRDEVVSIYPQLAWAHS